MIMVIRGLIPLHLRQHGIQLHRVMLVTIYLSEITIWEEFTNPPTMAPTGVQFRTISAVSRAGRVLSVAVMGDMCMRLQVTSSIVLKISVHLGASRISHPRLSL